MKEKNYVYYLIEGRFPYEDAKLFVVAEIGKSIADVIKAKGIQLRVFTLPLGRTEQELLDVNNYTPIVYVDSLPKEVVDTVRSKDFDDLIAEEGGIAFILINSKKMYNREGKPTFLSN